MAQSYVSAHHRRTDSASRLDFSSESNSETVYHDLEPSVFIFPNPSNRSTPSSPYASSSALSGSIPTDFDVSSSDQSHSRVERVSSRERRRISASTSGSSWNDLTDRRSLSWDTGLGSPDVEVWDFTGDEGEEIGHENAATSSAGAALGMTTTMGRMSRWDSHHAGHLQERRPQTRRPLQQAPTNVLAYVDRRQRALVHRQTDSVSPSRSEYMAIGMDSSLQPRRLILKSSSTAHLQELRNTSAPAESRLPLLSFFASLFSIDDDTLALLSSPSDSQTSILFRGPPTLVGLAFEEDDLIVAEKKRRVLLQLGNLYSSRLKEGVAVACDSAITPEDRFAVSFSLANIWALVGEVCQVPQRLWGDVWRPQERD